MAEGKSPAKQTPESDARTQFIKTMFSRYYSRVEIPAPSKLQQREFGVITERGGMWRHLGFRGTAELQNFLRKQVPLHAYHSSTYYEKPNARTMDEKIWLGADLIFDLDADHIPGTENMSMEDMLAEVKKQFAKLLEVYLLGDFGFDEKEVKVVFSGGRGYHAHVSNDKILRLDSHERREIVDYITRPNPEIENLIIRQNFDNKEFKGHFTSRYTYKLYPKDTPGWKGKVTTSVLDFIDRTEIMSRDDILKELMSFKHIGRTTAEQIYDSLYLGKQGFRGIDKIREDLNLEPFSKDSVRNSFINRIINDMSVELGGETDEPVTSDIKRLIRLPGSLHGKTGLRVIHLTASEFHDFIPLRDAVWDGYGESPVTVQGTSDSDINLKGDHFSLTKESPTELPEYAALFFACQKKCNIRN